MGQWECILYDGLDGSVLNPERPSPPGRVNKPSVLGPTELVVLLFMNGKFGFVVVVVVDIGLSVVQTHRTRLGLVPDGSLTSA